MEPDKDVSNVEKEGRIFAAVGAILFLLLYFGILNHNNNDEYDSDVNKIIKAKSQVTSMLNYPDTADFHEMKTEVHGNTVTLTVTAKNGFGVPETKTFRINVP